MARQINISHPLAANILALVGVDDDGVTLKDFASPTRTVTPNAAVTIGTGTYGYHMQTSGSGSNGLCVALSPTVSVGTLTSGGVPDFTVIMVLNKALPAGGGAVRNFLGSSGSSKTLPWIGVNTSGDVVVGGALNTAPVLSTTGGGYLDSVPFSVAVTRDSEVKSELFVDGTYVTEAANGIIASSDSNLFSQIGGYTTGAYGWRAAQVVWLIAFNKILTPTEIADIHNSLGADNQISLVETGNPSITPVSFSGPVADQVAYTNDPFSLNLSSYFSGNGTPFTYTLQAGTLPATLTLGSGGVLSGTPTATGSYTGLVIRATDSASNTADTNAFSLTVNEVNPNPVPTFSGPNIADITATQGVAMSSVNVSNRFSDTDSLTFSAVGTWPTGLGVSSAGLINGTATAVAGVYSNLRVRATDTASQTVDSNAFSVTVQEVVGVDGTITTEPLRNNTGMLLANVSGITAHVYTKAEGDKVVSLIGLMSDAAGVLTIASPLIAAENDYRVIVVLADGGEGVAGYKAS